jgi:hypothetical protein
MEERMAGVRIHWWHVKKGIVVDDSRLPALTQLLLRSEHHQRPPDGYQIFEVLPKLLGVLPRRARWVGDFGATPSSAPWSSVCWSDQIWGLSGPKVQGAEAVYVPRIDDVRTRLDTPAPRIRCADIFIDRLEQKSGWEAVLQPEVEVKGPSAGEAAVASVGAKIGRLGVERGKKIGFIGQTASDPAVQVDLLQGDSLLDFLRAWGQTYEEADPTPETPWEVLETYANGLTIEQEPDDGSSYGFGPDAPLRADVVVPQEDGSRGAFALRIRSLEDERLAISAPVFFNGVEGGASWSATSPLRCSRRTTRTFWERSTLRRSLAGKGLNRTLNGRKSSRRSMDLAPILLKKPSHCYGAWARAPEGQSSRKRGLIDLAAAAPVVLTSKVEVSTDSTLWPPTPLRADELRRSGRRWRSQTSVQPLPPLL